MLLTLTIGVGLPLVAALTLLLSFLSDWKTRALQSLVYFSYTWTAVHVAGGVA